MNKRPASERVAAFLKSIAQWPHEEKRQLAHRLQEEIELGRGTEQPEVSAELNRHIHGRE